MLTRYLSLHLAVFAAVLFLAAPLHAAEHAKHAHHGHVGKFISANGNEFTMEVKGMEHKHTLTADAKVIGPNGNEETLADLKKGEMIRVTTKENNIAAATKVEVLKKKKAALLPITPANPYSMR